MNKVNLTKTQKNMIRKWLTLRKDKSYECPFYREVPRLNRVDYCKNTCQNLFPKTEIVYFYEITKTERVMCPCDQLSIKYVTRRAKQFIQ